MQEVEYSKVVVAEIAKRYRTRVEWSCGDPKSYDWALFNLKEQRDSSQDEIVEIMAHMPDRMGEVHLGDPHDHTLSDMKHQIKKLEKEAAMYNGDEALICQIRDLRNLHDMLEAFSESLTKCEE